jgi:hypothetical protein
MFKWYRVLISLIVSTLMYVRLGNTTSLGLGKRVTFLHLDKCKLGWGILATFRLKLISIKNQHVCLIR